MNDRDKTDFWTALAVGAVVGVGAALLLRAGEEPESRGVLRSLRPVQQRAKRMAESASRQIERGKRELGSRGDDLLEQGVDTLADLRRDAARIVAQARQELEDMAQSSAKHARRAARRARRRFA